MLWRIRFVWYSWPLVLPFIAGIALGEGEPIRASLAVDWDAAGVHVEGAPLFGSHIATWDPPERWTPELIARLKAAGISALMFPGEATSANYFWNGHGIRGAGNHFDASKRDASGRWQIDYSGYAPGFMVNDQGELQDYHGDFDARTFHELARLHGFEPMVSLNVAWGTERDAAEWVRWANLQNNYGVTYWLVGQEVGGAGRPGYKRWTGEVLTPAVHARVTREFAEAMRRVDPAIKIIGYAALEGDIASLRAYLEGAAPWVDLVSLHLFPVSSGERLPKAADYFKRLDEIVAHVEALQAWMRSPSAPKAAQGLGLAVTGWNMVGDTDPEEQFTALSALWHAEFWLRMAGLGVSRMNHFRAAGRGSHPMLDVDTGEPRPSYWAAWLAHRYLPDEILPARIEGGGGSIRGYAGRRRDGSPVVWLFNRSEGSAAELALPALGGLDSSAGVEVASYGPDRYQWGQHAGKALVNAPPALQLLSGRAPGRVLVPPMTMTVIALRSTSAAALLPAVQKDMATVPTGPFVADLPEYFIEGRPTRVRICLLASDGGVERATSFQLSIERAEMALLQSHKGLSGCIDVALTPKHSGRVRLTAYAQGRDPASWIVPIKRRELVAQPFLRLPGLQGTLKGRYEPLQEEGGVRALLPGKSGYTPGLFTIDGLQRSDRWAKGSCIDWHRIEGFRVEIRLPQGIPGLESGQLQNWLSQGLGSRSGRAELKPVALTDQNYWVELTAIPLGGLSPGQWHALELRPTSPDDAQFLAGLRRLSFNTLASFPIKGALDLRSVDVLQGADLGEDETVITLADFETVSAEASAALARERVIVQREAGRDNHFLALQYADVERADYRGLPLKGPGAMIPDLAGARITEFRFRLRRGSDFAPPKQYAGLSLAILEPAGTWRELEEGQIQLNDCPSGEWARVRVPVSKRWQDELTGMVSLHFGLLNGGEQSLSGTLEIDDIAVVVGKRE